MAVPLFQIHGMTVCPSHGRPSFSNPWDTGYPQHLLYLVFKTQIASSVNPPLLSFFTLPHYLFSFSFSLFIPPPSLLIYSPSLPPYLHSFPNSFSLTLFL